MTVQLDQSQPIRRVALVSVHGCPLAVPGVDSAGGMNVYLREIAPFLTAKGICVDIFTRAHSVQETEDRYLSNNVRIIHIPNDDPLLQKERTIPLIPSISEWVKSFVAHEQLGYDLVHSHYWLSGLVGANLASYLGVPHAVTYHTIGLIKEAFYQIDEPSERKATEAAMASYSDKILAFTQEEAYNIKSLFHLPSGKISVAPGGVDLSLFQPSEFNDVRKELAINQHQKLVLYVGRLEPFKAPDILVRAIANVPNAVLVVIGGKDGDLGTNWLKELSSDLGVRNRVYFQEAMAQQFLPPYYSAADVLAIPSYHESFGLACLEAMACATPVVAANVGALRTLVEEGVTGHLVDKQDPEEYAKVLNRILENDMHRQNMGLDALRFASTMGWGAASDRLLEAYKELVAVRGPNPEVVTCIA